MNIFNPTPEFIAIGDVVIDAFIKLKNAHEVVNSETQSTELCMVFGTKLPFESAEEVVAVGNSANAAVAAARIGLSSGLIAHIGKDENGEKCIKKLKEEGVSTKFIQMHPGLHTNYHYVLWYGSERTILIKHENFPLTLPNISKTKWLYLSSLGETSLPFHSTIVEYLEKNPNIKLIFQPGTYQIKFGTDALKKIYEHTELFFCNLEEAQTILHIDTNSADAKNILLLLRKLRDLGPKLPVITDGPHGAYTFVQKDGVEKVAHLPIFPDIAPPQERTGAGDAFASTFSSAIALGKSVEDALKWGAINSMNVCQRVGAQAGLLTKAQIEAYIQNPPQGWNISIIN
ncbi:MAG: carbohydrate kinase family protein [Candidatus Taylorbacteria bacterium]|nr:carbohydrate kinase family protein [Candidatus Taylorbacteria bacterium]